MEVLKIPHGDFESKWAINSYYICYLCINQIRRRVFNDGKSYKINTAFDLTKHRADYSHSSIWSAWKKSCALTTTVTNICKKRMQRKTKGNPLHSFPFFFSSCFFSSGILLEKCRNFFNIMNNLRKLYALKKGNKNNIIHIYTSSNSMCSVGIGFCMAVPAKQKGTDENVSERMLTVRYRTLQQ